MTWQDQRERGLRPPHDPLNGGVCPVCGLNWDATAPLGRIETPAHLYYRCPNGHYWHLCLPSGFPHEKICVPQAHLDAAQSFFAAFMRRFE